MQYYGYAGKILHVDLTTGRVEKEDLDLEIARKFIGGYGLNARLAYDLIKGDTGPLSPENAIIIGAGPLVGTSVPGSSRCSAFTKLPQMNNIADADGSMAFASRLKYAGYDHLVITGRSPKPIYLKVFNDDVAICDACGLWGKDIFETTDELWKTHGRTFSVLAIGQAGENMVGMALAIIDKCGTIGKGGLGAVMGSKNLKAVIADGSKGITVFNPKKFRQLSNHLIDEMKDWPPHDDYVKYGHVMHDFDALFRSCGVINNHRELGDQKRARELFGPEVYLGQVLKKRISCPSCPIADKESLELKEGDFKGLTSFGGGLSPRLAVQLGIEDMDRAVKCRDILQRYGIDQHSFMGIAAFATELYERGLITSQDTGGLQLTRGFQTAAELARKMAFREGFGDVLADGFPAIADRFGSECLKYAVHNKFIPETTTPKMARFGVLQLCRIVESRNVGKGGMLNPGKFDPGASVDKFKRYGDRAAIPVEAMKKIIDPSGGVSIGRLARHTQDFYAVFSSLGICIRIHISDFYDMAKLSELYSAATGLEISPAELKQAGERAYNMVRALAARQGFSLKDERCPPRWLEPMKGKDGMVATVDQFGRPFTAADFEKVLDEYYDESGWNVETGMPTREKLIDLGLTDVAEDLKKAGVLP